MITFKEILKDLQFGELFNTQLGGDEKPNKQISPADYPQIAAYVELALEDLFTRFPLKYKEVIVQQYEAIARYSLHSDFAESNALSMEPIKYIKDSAGSPFLDDILKIEKIYDENGVRLTINDATDPGTVNVPSQTEIQISERDDANACFVIYRAKHPPLNITEDSDPTTVKIDLPSYLKKALLYNIGSRYYGSMEISNETQDAATYMQMYEMTCMNVETAGITQQENYDNKNIGDQGWV